MSFERETFRFLGDRAKLKVSKSSEFTHMQIAPDELFSGYSFANNTISIPLAALPGLSSAEANATTGNGMEVLRQVVESAQATIAGLAPTARPTKGTITKPNPSIASGQGVLPGTLSQNYTLTFQLTPTGLELAAEPS